MRAAALCLALALAACDDAGARPAVVESAAPVVAPIVASAPPLVASAPPPPRPPDPPIRLLFAGDLALALDVGENLKALAAGKKQRLGADYPFEHVRARIAAADFAIGNLECVASRDGRLATDHNPLRCPLAIAPLQRAGFDLVGIANNHAKDFGEDGFAGMLRELERAGLPYFGEGFDRRAPQRPHRLTLRGVRFGLLAYYNEVELADEDVRALRPEVDVLVTFHHWGNDWEPRPLLNQVRTGRRMIEAGADLVVGTHAHVVQPTGEHLGKPIVYGLGNFVFSGMSHDERFRVGAALEVDVDPRTRAIVATRMPRIRLDDDGAPRWLEDAE